MKQYPNLQKLFSITVKCNNLQLKLQRVLSKWINDMLQRYVYAETGEVSECVVVLIY